MANSEKERNKAKITSTSVTIAAQKTFDPTTTSKTTFMNVANASRQQNTGLDPLTTSYITGSHFKTGYGGFGGVSEQKGKFGQVSLAQARNSISPDRVKFFKDSHFDHNKPGQSLQPSGIMRSDFTQQPMVNRNVINEQNNAYRLKNFRHDYGKIGNQASNMVPDNAMRFKWVQP